MSIPEFAGDKKVPLRSPLARLEKQFIEAHVSRFPPWIEGYHLTLLTIAWSAGLVFFGWLAARNTHFLWGASLMLFLQWFTDSFDGALGRHRDTGIPKWGFYMDHLLDFVFMWCIPVSYLFLVPAASAGWLIAATLLISLLMVNSFLSFAATNAFKITYLGLGPTELRLAFILLNTLLAFRGPGPLVAALPAAVVILFAGVALVIYRTQAHVWAIDRADCRARRGAPQR